jgi:hypothetical protein
MHRNVYSGALQAARKQERDKKHLVKEKKRAAAVLWATRNRLVKLEKEEAETDAFVESITTNDERDLTPLSGVDDEICSKCSEQLVAARNPVGTSCNHHFCLVCLEGCDACPECRKDLTNDLTSAVAKMDIST